MNQALVKQFFKDAEAPEALAMYAWIQAALEVRGLIEIPVPGRKRRSDAGIQRVAQMTTNAQPSLSGLPDEDRK